MKIIVFGLGKYYKKKASYLSDNYEICAFLDNNADRIGNYFGNVPVYSPYSIGKLPEMPVYVMVSARYVVDVVNQLLSLKVKPELIKLGFGVNPPCDEFEELINSNRIGISVKAGGICVKYGIREEIVKDNGDFFRVMRNVNKVLHPYIDVFADMPTVPANRRWGNPFGKPIDRRYIEDFICRNSRYITGDVVEIADTTYTEKFGHDLQHAYALHIYGEGNAIKGNLATGEGISENFCDCLVCTQTLQFIYDLHSTVRNIYKMLKPGGTALITVPGISQIDIDGYKKWGEAWRFTKQSLRSLFEESFAKENICVESYGNVKTAICFLYGMSQEDLKDDDYQVNDEMYPVILTLICRK